MTETWQLANIEKR